MKIAVAGATGRVGRHVCDILTGAGHEVVAMSRSTGVDVISGAGLDGTLAGSDAVIDAATGPSPDQKQAEEFFTTSVRNLQQAGERAGVGRVVLVSIVGADRFSGGYNAAKIVQEDAWLAGRVPVRVLRATQFHEFVGELVGWGTQGDVAYLPRMRTQLVAARTVAEALAELATTGPATGPTLEIAGPREEDLVEAAKLLAARRLNGLRIEAVDPTDPDGRLLVSGGALPGPEAKLAGPTFEEWLNG
jgi:uncharacterized protein YbjT (DUF2867 family)